MRAELTVRAMVIGLSLVFSGLVTDAYADQRFYRYLNDQGVMVLDYQVPTHLVKNGYEVVSSSGQVLEVVAPYKAQTEDDIRAAALAEQQRQEDSLLLKSYSNIDELYSARDRKLQGLSREIELITSNIAESQALLDGVRAQAAKSQRSGRALRADVITQIDTLITEINDGKKMLKLRKQESLEAESRYQRYADRFKELIGGVETPQ